MARFNKTSAQPVRSRSPLTTGQTPDTVNHEGASAYTRDDKSALFLLGMANFVSTDTFYESGKDRDTRFVELTRKVAVADGDWLSQFLRWLRREGNMRSAPLVAAAEGVHARLEAGLQGPVNGLIIKNVLLRADEPGELIGYWRTHWGEERSTDGRTKPKLPYPVKKGIARAIEGMILDEPARVVDEIENDSPKARQLPGIYSEYSALKYDTPSKSVRFADVIELTHPRGLTDRRSQLFTWLLDRRHKRAHTESPTSQQTGQYPLLEMVAARADLENIAPARRRSMLESGEITDLAKKAGATWEWLASWLGGALDGAFWDAMIPQMGYMALLRNLRNFDEKGISKESVEFVLGRLTDPAQVAKSRQFPFRFLTAYHNVPSDRWSSALSDAATLSVSNVPTFTGRTLVLVDTSGSMDIEMSQPKRNDASWSPTRAHAAALFGTAVKIKNGASVDLRIFANRASPSLLVPAGSSLLKAADKISQLIGEVGHGTNIAGSIAQSFDGHDRVLVFTDEQTFGFNFTPSYIGDVTNSVPPNVPIYSWNLAGYAGAMMPSGPGRYQLGGITDATFRMIPLIEAGARAQWPWLDSATKES